MSIKTGPTPGFHRRRELTTRQWAFQNISSSAFDMTDNASATIADLAKMLIAIEEPPEMDETELEQFGDNDERLVLLLAEAYPATVDELLLKVERALARLLRSVAEGDLDREIVLGSKTLDDVRFNLRKRGVA